MHILILNWRDPKNPKSGGAEIVTMEHAKAWVKTGYQITWFTSKYENAKSEEIVNGVEIVRRGNFITVFIFAFLFYLFSGQKFDFVIDEIHGVPFFTPLYVQKPKIAFIHEVAGEIWDYMYKFPINMLGKIIEALYFQLYKSVRFWTDAETTIDDLVKKGIKRNNCTAIYCPINNLCLNKLPAKEKYPTYVFISRVVKMKGIEDIIKAFSLIASVQKKARLWIVGAGERFYISFLKKIIKEHKIAKKVYFYGYVNNNKKLALLRRSHLLLHASIKEGWGLVVLEAASQATPSVVYSLGGLRDTVKNGTTGIVLSYNNPKEMARVAIELYNDKKKYLTFQKNCLLWAKSLSWHSATKQSLRLIESISKDKI